MNYFRQGCLFREKSGRFIKQITSLVFIPDRFKIPLLGETETTIRLGIKSWGAQQSHSILGLFFLPITGLVSVAHRVVADFLDTVNVKNH